MWPPPKNWNITSTQNTASQPTPASPPEVPGILSFAQCRRVSVLLIWDLVEMEPCSMYAASLVQCRVSTVTHLVACGPSAFIVVTI